MNLSSLFISCVTFSNYRHRQHRMHAHTVLYLIELMRVRVVLLWICGSSSISSRGLVDRTFVWVDALHATTPLSLLLPSLTGRQARWRVDTTHTTIISGQRNCISPIPTIYLTDVVARRSIKCSIGYDHRFSLAFARDHLLWRYRLRWNCLPL